MGLGLKPKQSGLCSTWGNFHFKTFDGEIYRFPGICNYLFAAHCGKHFEDFNIQIQQSLVNNLPVIAQISVKLNELLIEIIDHNPTVHGLQEDRSADFNREKWNSGWMCLIEQEKQRRTMVSNEKLTGKIAEWDIQPTCDMGIQWGLICRHGGLLVFVFQSHGEFHRCGPRPQNYTTLATEVQANGVEAVDGRPKTPASLILNKKYMGEACGLCGDYNGDPSNDLVYEGNLLEPLQFGKLHKLRKPEQICEDPEPETTERCIIYKRMCLQQLKNSKWTMCNRLVKTDPYVDAYMLDMCLCNATEKYSAFCLCTTIAEYSRQCAVAGGRPPEWRSQTMCYKPCPLNLIYNECSPPCAPTCSNPGRHFFCDGPCVAGCTCPKGYVLDDITNLGCIVMKNCSCTYNNQIYPPGSVYNGTCHTWYVFIITVMGNIQT
ncbi:mucin-5B-like [Mixophyes fleayi]|uniref:mucin-5B-like n=1 Tax=Mixophyes fleayi TaxID=3061075 RepID=UPI003F4E1E63